MDNDIIPSNLVLNVDIVGADATNPNGNGSGMVNIEVSATNAIKFDIKFDNSPAFESLTGIASHTFTESGTVNYIISVIAYSSTNNSISTFKTISVFVDNGQFQLIWSDEFNNNGAPNSSKWSYDIGSGGWGNGESQYYTDRSENVIIEDGLLKI